MKILVYSLNFAPELTGVGKYSGELAQWLAAHGHDVTVVTSLPYYPGWQVDKGYRASYLRACPRSSLPRMAVYRSPLWVPRKPSGVKRVLHLISFALLSLPILVRELARRPDVAFVVIPTLTIAPQAAALGWLFRVHTWLHVHDFEIDAALRLDVLRLKTGSSLLFAAERGLLRGFDRVSTISIGMLERLVKKGVPASRCRLFPNWVDIAAIAPPVGENVIRIELGLGPNDVLVLYAGNMGEKQGLEVVIDAALMLHDAPEIKFLLVGDGSARSLLQARAASIGNLIWWPLQPKERLNELLHAADLHVLPQRAGAADLVMPSKLGPMLASGRLVVGTAEPKTELGYVLDDVGLRVNPGDADALAEAIRRCAKNPQLRRERGDKGRAFAARTLDKEAVLNTFQSECETLRRTG